MNCKELIRTPKVELNIRNRSNKLKKFTFESSEDALTWVFFKHLVDEQRIGDFLDVYGIPHDNKLNVYLWGVPISDGNTSNFISSFISISDKIGEVEESRSEPDVIIHSPNYSLTIIEVKYKSGNDIETRLNKSDKYISYSSNSFNDLDLAKKSGHYELIRNWVFGVNLAKNTPFYLINLGMRKLFEGNPGKKLDSFINSLNTIKKHRGFIKCTWNDLLSELEIYNSEIHEYLKTKLG